MSIIDFNEAKKRKLVNKKEYAGSVTITIQKNNEKGTYSFYYKLEDMDYEEMVAFLMDIAKDIRENTEMKVFNVSESDIIERPIKITLFLPEDDRSDDFAYSYEYEKEPETEMNLDTLSAIITNTLNNL